MTQPDPSWEAVETFPAGASTYETRVWMSDGDRVWMGWRDAEGWQDAAEWAGDNKDARFGGSFAVREAKLVPTLWSARLPENHIDLPEELDDAGQALSDAVDEDALPVQGAMWVHDGERWVYLLVTPEIDLVYAAVPAIFRSGRISQAMILDDVLVVGPYNYMFQLVVKLVKSFGRGRREFRGEIRGRHTTDDGTSLVFWLRPNAVIYRSLKTVDGSDFHRPDTAATLMRAEALQ